MFEGLATVKISPRNDNGVIFLMAIVDDSIGEYYRSVIKWMLGQKLNSPLYGYHITLANGRYDDLNDVDNNISGQKLRFCYDSKIYQVGFRHILPVYDVFSDLTDFRRSLGLTPTTGNIPWHMTIGHYNE